jgi:hypothetical protein
MTITGSGALAHDIDRAIIEILLNMEFRTKVDGSPDIG